MNDNFDVSDISGETGRRLAKEPRLTVVLGGRSDDAPWEGGINGHFFRIKRGEPVEGPESLAKLIRQNEQIGILSRRSARAYASANGKKRG